MPFQNDIVGGTKLLIPAIQSPNYVPGVSGWRIARDGSAEFSNITSRGPVVVTDPSTGNVLASLGATGNIAGQVGTFNDVIVGGQSLDTLLAGLGRGIIGYWDIGAVALPAPASGVFTDIAWVRCNWDATRVVRVTTRQLGVQTSALTYANLTSQWIYTNSLTGTITFGTQVQAVPSANGGGTLFPDAFANVAYFADANPAATNGRATFRLQAKSTNASTTFNNGGWGLIIEEIGPLSAVTTFRDGGTGTPSGVTTYTTQYNSLDSQGFNGSGTSQGITNLFYSGDPTGSPGPFPQRGMWTFNGAQMRADTAGATLISATLYMYCLNSSNTSGGGTALGWLANSTIPGSYPGAGANITDFSGYPLPGWQGVNVLSQVASNVLSGINANSVMCTLDITLPDSTFAGFSSGFKPYLVLSYSK